MYFIKMAEMRGVEVLQIELEKSRDKLKGYNENIKKLTGRDPNRSGVRRMLSGGDRNGEDGFQNRMARGRGRLFGLARRSIMEDTGPPAKRRVVGGAFSRLGPAPKRQVEREDSPDEEELPQKLSVQSSVIATSREAKNRVEIMQEQTKDKEGMQRNRRMFGLLLGTLNKFKTESKTLETKDVQRKKIEDKLEEKAEKERKKFKQETKLLMEEMHLEQSKISRLEQKMEIVQEHADREAEMMKLRNFIATKAKPRIFWKPVQMTTATESKMKDSKKFVDDLLQEGKDRLDKEILDLMQRETKREERIKMRMREDGLIGDENEGEGDDAGISEQERIGPVREVIDAKGDGVIIRNIKEEIDDDTKEDIEEEEEEMDSAKKKPRRTVIVESENREADIVEEEVREDDGGATIGDDEEEEGEIDREVSKDLKVPVLRQDDSTTEKEAESKNETQGSDKDSEEEETVQSSGKKQNRDTDGVESRKSVEEKERKRSRERNENTSRHRSGQREDKNRRRRDDSSSEERVKEKRKEDKRERDRSRERGRDGSKERDRKKHRDREERKSGRWESRERSRRDSKD